MAENLKLRIMEALQTVQGLDAGAVEGLHVSESGEAVFTIEVDPAQGPALEPMRQAAERAVMGVRGVKSARAILTAERQAAPAQSHPDPHGMNKNPKLESLPIRHILAVASGKGGVGKSTVAANLAYALAQAGFKTGLLDADIYGPSVPKITGVEGQKPGFTPDNKIIPLEAQGLKVMSIGFLLKEGQEALIWRGPMVQSALYQMFRDVEWAPAEDPLDVLIVDMPPGTGDAQLTLAQKVPVSGAVIVSTPQDIALIDARKAVEMFRKTGVPVWGLIENMSLYICPSCGHEDHIFGHGGAREEAARLDIPFLGELPLTASIRQRSDRGELFGLEEPVYKPIAARIERS